VTNESSPFDLKTVWTSQLASGITLSREAMAGRMKMRERKHRYERMSFWIGQICLAAGGIAAMGARSYLLGEVLRESCLALWVILYSTGYAHRVCAGSSGIALGLNPSVHSLVDTYRDNLSKRRDFYRHASFLVVPCLVIGVFSLPGIAAIVQGRVSALLLIPYGLLLALSISLYAFRRRIVLPGIEREIRELDEFRTRVIHPSPEY
jgi:hypothetical protein